MDRLLLRPAECADAIGCSRALIYRLLATRELPSVQVGGRLRVPVDKLREWVQQRVREQTNAR